MIDASTSCCFFAQGCCQNGAACPFSHGGEIPTIWALPTVCYFYHTTGCKNGAACPFRHEPLTQSPWPGIHGIGDRGPDYVYAKGIGDEYKTLYVGNVAWGVTSDQLLELFGGIGNVICCEVKRDSKGQSKGFALVTFRSEGFAEVAIAKFNGFVHEGRKLVVRPDQAEVDRSDCLPGLVAPSARVFVGNVPFATTQEEFARVFEDAGVDAQGATLSVASDQSSRGHGFVRFKDEAAAAAALDALQGLEIGGRCVHIEYAWGDDVAP